MSWQVTARVSGGCKYSTEETEAYLRAAKALSHAADELNRAHDSFRALRLQLSTYPYASSAVVLLSGSNSYCNAADHIELPYDQLIERCDGHASALGAMAARLSELSALIIRAQSLYSHVDDAGRKALNELLQLTITAFPKESILIGTAMSALGYVMGSINEGKSNPIYLLDSLDWAQEGIMGAAGAALSRYGKVKGLLHTDEVNHAAGTISNATSRGYNLIQGNNLTVTRVRPKTEVVRESHSVSEAMEDLRRLGEERLGKADLDSGLEYGTIAISKYRRTDGTNSWLVTIPGTDGQPDSPFGWPQNVELMSSHSKQRMEADSARMVQEALKQAGIKSDEPVALIGHSQGGIVAATIASDLKDDYDIKHVVTAGSARRQPSDSRQNVGDQRGNGRRACGSPRRRGQPQFRTLADRTRHRKQVRQQSGINVRGNSRHRCSRQQGDHALAEISSSRIPERNRYGIIRRENPRTTFR